MSQLTVESMRRACEHAVNFIERLDGEPVASQTGLDELRTRFGGELPQKGVGASSVIDELVDAARGGLLGSAGGRFFAWVIGGALPSALAADWLAATWNQNAALYACSPAAAVVEEVAGDWLRDLLGIPPESSFAFTSGCQMAGMPEKLEWQDTSPGWNESGQKLLVTGVIFQPDGKTPASGVVLYYYHTNTEGKYVHRPDVSRSTAPNELGQTHGFLRGWIRTGMDGKYAIYTVKPAPYPNDTIPAHIHATIKEADIAAYYIDDFVFDSDPLVDGAYRSKAENRCGNGIMHLERKDDQLIGRRDIILGQNIPDYRKEPDSGGDRPAALSVPEPVLSGDVAGDITGETVFASQDLLEDLGIFKRAYSELHPGLYRYNTKEQIAAGFERLADEFKRDRTLREAYLAYSLFLAKLKCGHSYANFFNQPDAIAKALFEGKDKVPFHFVWLDGRMIVTKNFSDDARIAAGTEILEINSVPSKEILDKLMSVARADGSNDAKRIDYLSVTGSSRIEAFEVYYPLFFPMKSKRLAVCFQPFQSAEAVSSEVAALTFGQRLTHGDFAGGSDDRDDKPAFTLWRLDHRTAVLRMPGWALFNSTWDWKKFIDESMDQLIAKKIANLIVDLRGNEGGLDIGDALIAIAAGRDVEIEAVQKAIALGS